MANRTAKWPTRGSQVADGDGPWPTETVKWPAGQPIWPLRTRPIADGGRGVLSPSTHSSDPHPVTERRTDCEIGHDSVSPPSFFRISWAILARDERASNSTGRATHRRSRANVRAVCAARRGRPGAHTRPDHESADMGSGAHRRLRRAVAHMHPRRHAIPVPRASARLRCVRDSADRTHTGHAPGR